MCQEHNLPTLSFVRITSSTNKCACITTSSRRYSMTKNSRRSSPPASGLSLPRGGIFALRSRISSAVRSDKSKSSMRKRCFRALKKSGDEFISKRISGLRYNSQRSQPESDSSSAAIPAALPCSETNRAPRSHPCLQRSNKKSEGGFSFENAGKKKSRTTNLVVLVLKYPAVIRPHRRLN